MTKNHGGDRSNNAFAIKESTHQEKHDINTVEKTEISQKKAALIEDGDIIFLCSGTTVELLVTHIHHQSLSVVTNFCHLKDLTTVITDGSYFLKVLK